MWGLRNVGEIVNVQEVYAGYPNIFSIELHHGGSFTKFPNIRYINGQVRYFDVVDIDEFSVHELDLIMRELGYDGTEIMYYHFRLPNEGFDFGLRALGNDDDVRNLSRYVTHNNKMIKVYTEHGQTNLLTYFMSPTGPRRVIIEDMEKQDSIRPSSPVVAHEVVTPIQIDVGEGDLGLALTLYKSATPEFSRSKGWKHSKGASSTRKFRRIYVCLGPLKKGFKAGLREFLGLDGAFMKGPFPGQILSAVGVDSNNGTYPLAYAVVESENTSSWKWFLQCLAEDLELYSNSNFTFISDRQKGLLPAIEQLFPNAEHRFCIRHIYQNMRIRFKTTEYKEYFWRCATATTIPEFEAVMVELRNYDIEAYQWLLKIPPHHWARSHFSGRAISDMLLNNLCEVFNSKLVKGRDKPIISCLEFIREYLMKRVCNVMKVLNKCQGPLTPTGTRILESNTTLASKYHARWNGGQKYQVKVPWNDQHVVDMEKRECSCRKWELTGIPCKHAVASLNEMADNNEKVGELYTYVHKVYWLDTWKEMYSFKVEPIKGRAMWPKSDCPTTLVPPPHNKAIGRPKKKRRITAEERIEIQQRKRQANSQSQNDNETQSLSRKFLTVTCSKSQTTETKPTRQANTSSAGPLQPHTYSLFSTVLGMHRNDDQGFVKSMRFAQQQRSHRSRAPFLNLVAVEVDETRRRRIL
uniref:SWIM-type domain-containing protein n=1 Tax=Lactuca sativa TaxID=4236 RepID=A0A9R1WEZ1_LACSA|nr:hypothetical protein LSAT_V11C200087730 [Lactuca sativa]